MKMKSKLISMITVLALVFAMMPAMVFADEGGAPETTKISFSDCKVIGENEGFEAPIYYATVEKGQTNIELTDLDGKMEDGIISGVHSAFVMEEGTNIVDLSKGYSISFDDFKTAVGDGSLNEGDIKGLDFSNLYAIFITDDDDNSYYLAFHENASPKTYGFKAFINGKELTEIKKEERAYTYTNWKKEQLTVDLYTLTIPVDTPTVDFRVDNPVIAYNYSKANCVDDDYLDAATSTEAYMTGASEFSAKVDSNSDGKTDYVQFQTPYDSAYNTTLLYAFTFKYSDESVAKKVADMINALPEKIKDDEKEKVQAAREAFDALTEKQKALISEKIKKKLADAEAAIKKAKENKGGNETQKPSSEPVAKVIGGKTYIVKAQKYKVTKVATGNNKGIVTFTKAKNEKKVVVPAAIKLADGKVYNVVTVGAKAFTGKKIRSVTIGKNVKKLMRKAFAKSKATKMIVKTKKLKKATVKGSLKGSKIKKISVKIGSKRANKKQIKKYKKIFTKKNAGKKVIVK